MACGDWTSGRWHLPAASGHEAADFAGRPLEDRLDAGVGKVPHPAAHAVPLGHLPARAEEEHALHPARDQHPVANHLDSLFSV
jgi:hypothetical protein